MDAPAVPVEEEEEVEVVEEEVVDQEPRVLAVVRTTALDTHLCAPNMATASAQRTGSVVMW